MTGSEISESHKKIFLVHSLEPLNNFKEAQTTILYASAVISGFKQVILRY